MKHENIVGIHDVYSAFGVMDIMLELCKGGSMRRGEIQPRRLTLCVTPKAAPHCFSHGHVESLDTGAVAGSTCCPNPKKSFAAARSTNLLNHQRFATRCTSALAKHVT